MQEGERQYEMAKNAILEAVSDADLNNSDFDRKRIGLYLGESKINLFRKDFSLENSLINKLKETFCFYGENITLSASCATGILTIIKGCQFIKNRLCDVVICGCSETSIHPLYIAGFKNMGVLTKHNPSPFDKNRDGFAVGEGACFVVIESIEKALMRNTGAYCKIDDGASGMYSDKPLSINSYKSMASIVRKATNS
jgi:3-oxoacyl-[acyl-carrier-protein] synthase II